MELLLISYVSEPQCEHYPLQINFYVLQQQATQ